MVERTPYNVVVLPITDEHKEVFNRVSNRMISHQELLCAAVEWWLHHIRLQDTPEGVASGEEDVYNAIHEALWSLEDWELQTLAALHRMRVSEAISAECDQLTHEVMQMGEDLSTLLNILGSSAEGIMNICRLDWDDCAAYLYCYFDLGDGL